MKLEPKDVVGLKGRERLRMRTRMRDNLTCQSCGKKWKKDERHFDVHHLNGLCGKLSRAYDERGAMFLLLTVCHKCHYMLHKKTSLFSSKGRGKKFFSRVVARNLRKKGFSFDKIAASVGVSYTAIQRMFSK